MSESRSGEQSAVGGASRAVEVRRYPIRLDQFLKLAVAVATGGEAKGLIADGQVKVDGAVECRRGRQLRGGEVVSVEGVGSYLAVRTS